MNIPYTDAKKLIKEADVLLFRAGKFPGVGWWIGKYTQSPYSHVGLAHWEDGELYCLEFREFKGSRMYPMDQYITEGSIEVFRPIETVIYSHILDGSLEVSYSTHDFTADVAIGVTNVAKELLGKKYSYWTIFQMFKTYVPFIRLGRKIVKNGEPIPRQFVCSTLITYAFRNQFLDPVPFLSDGHTTPGDIARSGLFHKLFEIA